MKKSLSINHGLELRLFLKNFADEEKKFCINLHSDVDTSPGITGFNHDLDTQGLTFLSLDKQRTDLLNKVGDELIDLVIKEESRKQILIFDTTPNRVYLFAIFDEYLVIIKNSGMGHHWQGYEITIEKP